MRLQKFTYSNFFIILVVMLILLPFLTTFQDILTRLVLKFDAYDTMQNLIVPYELKILSTILNLIGIEARAGNSYIQFVKDGRPEIIFLAWNCIGWQSFVFLLVSLVSGLSGNFTRGTKVQALLIGVLGTYLVNILRLSLVVVVYFLASREFGIIFHDYFSNLLSVIWLFLFWWISFTFVLEEKYVTQGQVEAAKEDQKAI